MAQTISVYTDDACDIYVELGTPTEPVLVRWSAPRPQGRPSRIQGYALLGSDGPVLVDPPGLDEAALARLRAVLGSPPRATVLTSDWHERAAYRLRDRWGTPVWAPAAGLPEWGASWRAAPTTPTRRARPCPPGCGHCRSRAGCSRRSTCWCGRPPPTAACCSPVTRSTGRRPSASPSSTTGAERPACTWASGRRCWAGTPIPRGCRPACAGRSRRTSTCSAARTPGPIASTRRRPSPSCWRRTGRPSPRPGLRPSGSRPGGNGGDGPA